MAKELLKIVVTQESERSIPTTKIFENGVEVKTYINFNFSVGEGELPSINGEKILFDPDYTKDEICNKKN